MSLVRNFQPEHSVILYYKDGVFDALHRDPNIRNIYPWFQTCIAKINEWASNQDPAKLEKTFIKYSVSTNTGIGVKGQKNGIAPETVIARLNMMMYKAEIGEKQ